ncbi:MAG: hypothetical protein GXO73_03885, partial [Calditrichaeota bacterium]|nr:hypothetical protein [Calditrichota bacterium]
MDPFQVALVPAAFVTLEAFPLTPNGKIDRRALPSPKVEVSRVTEDTTPRSPTEELLAEIFAEVLGLERVSPTDDFFELGGHSLLATQLASRVKRAFGIDLPLREVFER